MHGIECATGWLTRPALPCPAQTDPFPIEPTPKGAQASQLSPSEIAPPRPKPTPIPQNGALKAPRNPGAMHRTTRANSSSNSPLSESDWGKSNLNFQGGLLKGMSQASQWGCRPQRSPARLQKAPSEPAMCSPPLFCLGNRVGDFFCLSLFCGSGIAL